MKSDRAADPVDELARLDHLEYHLRRLDAFGETAQRELALARKLVWERATTIPTAVDGQMLIRSVSKQSGLS
jgi:hypothetical protein